MITLFFENFLYAPLESPISQKLLEGDKKYFLRFEELMKLPSISNFLFPWRRLSHKIKVISILKNMKKTVIFLIFADIKRHNSKYLGQFLIKFGHNNIESLNFKMPSVLFENFSPLTFYSPLN